MLKKENEDYINDLKKINLFLMVNTYIGYTCSRCMKKKGRDICIVGEKLYVCKRCLFKNEKTSQSGILSCWNLKRYENLDYQPKFLYIDEDEDEDMVEDINEGIKYEHWEEDDKIFFAKVDEEMNLSIYSTIIDEKMEERNLMTANNSSIVRSYREVKGFACMYKDGNITFLNRTCYVGNNSNDKIYIVPSNVFNEHKESLKTYLESKVDEFENINHQLWFDRYHQLLNFSDWVKYPAYKYDGPIFQTSFNTKDITFLMYNDSLDSYTLNTCQIPISEYEQLDDYIYIEYIILV